MNRENCDSFNALRISNNEGDSDVLDINTNSSSPLILKRSSAIGYDDNIPYVDSHSIETAKESPKIKIATTNHDFDNISDNIGVGSMNRSKGGSASSLKVSALQTDWPSSEYIKSIHKHHGRTHSSCDPNRGATREVDERYSGGDISIDNLDSEKISYYLSKSDEKNRETAKAIMNNFKFDNLSLHEALQIFTGKIPIIGESQERERILTNFTNRFMECNGERYKNFDACHTLVCALMLLNTDLHSQMSRKKMTCDEFISNLNENYPQYGYSKEDLTLMYIYIKKNEFKMHKVATNKPTVSSIGRKVSKYFIKPLSKTLSFSNSTPKISLNASILEGKTFISGNIVRRCVARAYGRKPLLGHRGWKLQYASVRGLNMLLFKTNLNSSGGTGSGSDQYQPSVASVVSVNMDTDEAGGYGDDRMSVADSVASSEVIADGSSSSGVLGSSRNINEFSKQATKFNSTSSITTSSRDSSYPGHTATLGPEARLSTSGNRFFASGSRDSLARYSQRNLSAQTTNSSNTNEINLDDVSESLELHHCLAKLPDKHRGSHKNVFSLHLCDMSVYQFKVDISCLNQWINTINYAAALLSAPPIVGAGHTDVYKPLLPRNETDRDRNGQIESFQTQITNYKASLDKLLKEEVNRPTGDVQKDIQFCHFEIHRFETYVELLRQTDPSIATTSNRNSPSGILANANRIFGDNNSNMGTNSDSLDNSESSLTMMDYPIQQQYNRQNQPYQNNESDNATLRKRPPQPPSSNQIARKLFHTPSPSEDQSSLSITHVKPHPIVRRRSGSATRSRSVNMNQSNLITGCYGGNRPNRCFSSTHYSQCKTSNSTYSPSFSRFIDPNPVSMVTKQNPPLLVTSHFTNISSPQSYNLQHQPIISPDNDQNNVHLSSRNQSPLTGMFCNNPSNYYLSKPPSFNHLPRYSPPNSASFQQPPLSTSTPLNFHVNSHQYHQYYINNSPQYSHNYQLHPQNNP